MESNFYLFKNGVHQSHTKDKSFSTSIFTQVNIMQSTALADSAFPETTPQLDSAVPAGFVSKEEALMATGNLTRLFLTFSIPGICGILFLSLQTLADGILLGRFAGAAHMAGVNVALPCISLLMAVSLVVAVGCETMVSLNMGRGKRRLAGNALTSAVALTMGISGLWGIVLFAFTPQIAAFSGADATLLPLCVSYLRTLAPFFPAVALLFVTDYTLKSLGRPMYAVTVMTGVVVLNVVLDLLFIVGFGWGIGGAALATGLSFSAGLLCDLIPLCSGRMPLNLLKGHCRPAVMQRLLRYGAAEGFSECAMGVSILLFNITIVRLAGPDGIAAFTILNYLLYIATAVFLGIADGMRPVLGYNYGRQNHDRVRGLLVRGIIGVIVLGAGLAAALFFGGEAMLRQFFNPADASVARMAAEGSAIFAWGLALEGLNILTIGSYTSFGKTRVAGILVGLRSLLFVVAGLAVFPAIWGLRGVWMVLPVAEGLALCVAAPLLWRAFKTQN